MRYRDTILRAARTEHGGIAGVDANETWTRVGVHGVPLAGYVGKGAFGTEKLREEIMAENVGVDIPMAMRWLGRPTDIEARAAKGEITASSVTSGQR